VYLQLIVYGCNLVHIWLQLTEYTAATSLLLLHSVIDISCFTSMYLTLYGCNALQRTATHCNALQHTALA